MKNLIHERADKLEALPKREQRETRIKHQVRSHHWGAGYPSNKVSRFLQSNVGQPWDKVYSKYHNLDWIPVDMRDLEHIKWHVITDTFIKNGKVVHIGDYHSGETSVDAHCREQFYVHPITKLLCVSTPPRPNRVLDRTINILGDFHQLLKLDGIWYEVKAKPTKPDDGLTIINGLYYEEAGVEPVERWHNGKLLKDIAPADGVKYKIHNGKLYLPAKSPRRYGMYGPQPLGPKDRIIEEPNGKPRWMRWQRIDERSFKITLRRQLNSKDLKKFGLKNDPPPPAIRCGKCGGIVGRDCRFHYCVLCNKPNEQCKCRQY